MIQELLESQVDPLLNIPENRIIRRKNIIDILKHQSRGTKIREMSSIEPGLGFLFNYLANQIRKGPQFSGWGLVGHPKRKNDAPLLHLLVVMHPAARQIRIGHHQLLSSQGPDTGSLDPHLLYCAQLILKDNEIPQLKGTVKVDYQVVEKIPQDSLRRYSHGNPGDAESGNNGGDIEAEIVQYKENTHRPNQQVEQGDQGTEPGRHLPVWLRFGGDRTSDKPVKEPIEGNNHRCRHENGKKALHPEFRPLREGYLRRCQGQGPQEKKGRKELLGPSEHSGKPVSPPHQEPADQKQQSGENQGSSKPSARQDQGLPINNKNILY